MEQIKKKLATLKEEKEVALEKAEEATQLKKEAEAKADAVSRSLSPPSISLAFSLNPSLSLSRPLSLFPAHAYTPFNMKIVIEWVTVYRSL